MRIPRIPGTIYYYKVRAWASIEGYSEYSNIDSGYIALKAPANITASDGIYTDKIIISWSSVSGAEKYYIYRSTDLNGSYNEIGSTRENYYEDLTAELGTTYYYKVKARSSENIYSEYSLADSGFSILVWVKTYSGNYTQDVSSITEKSDNGFIFAGWASNEGEYSDFWIVNLDKSGNIIWQKKIGGSNVEHAPTIIKTSNDDFIFGGYSSSFVGGNILLAKMRSNADIVWQKVYGFHGGCNDNGQDLIEVDNKNYIMTGYTDSFGAGGYDIWVLKLDDNGNILWQKTYGGISNDYPRSIFKTLDGGFIITCETESFGAGLSDVWVIKFDKDGNIVWQKTYGGSNSDSGASIIGTTDNGYIVTGQTNSYGAGNGDILILKLDNMGNILWQKAYGGVNWEHPVSIIETLNNNYIIVGFTFSFGTGDQDVWVLKLDSEGNIIWQKTYGTPSADMARSMIKTTDNGIIIVGYSNGTNGVWVLKLGQNGEPLYSTADLGLGMDSNASVTDTLITPSDTEVSPLISEASVSTVECTITNTNAIVTTQYPPQ